MQLANINSSDTVSNIDIIDVLPRAGVDRSHFSGTATLKSVTIEAGSTAAQPIVVLYSKDTSVKTNPQDASNVAATATTTWCDAPTGGKPVIGKGSCPTAAADITAFRLLRAGGFPAGEMITATVTTTPKGNAAGDVYDNRTSAAMVGLMPIGPVHSPATIVASSVGDYVWFDQNKDGIQDNTEKGIPNVTVTLTGKDDLGNTIAPLTVTTDATGKYTVPNLRKGTYRVVVDKTTPPGILVNTYSLGGGTTAPSNDSLDVTIGNNESRNDVDFGYYQFPVVPPPTTPGEVITELAKTGHTQLLFAMVGLSVVIIGLATIAATRRFAYARS